MPCHRLGLIVYPLIGLAHDLLPKFLCHKEELPMKTKAIKVLVAVSKSILNSIWTVGTNLLADARWPKPIILKEETF